MYIISITCVKNECDIIEAFVRHTSKVIDCLIIMDNGSSDETTDILNSLKKEGLPVEIISEPTLGNFQWQRMTRLMHESLDKKKHADWIIPLDADEFLITSNKDHLNEFLSTKNGLLKIKWKTYVPTKDDNLEQINPVLRIRNRLIMEYKEWTKVIIPNNLAQIKNAQIDQGNHNLLIDNKVINSTEIGDSVFIAHFPVRSLSQYASKVSIGVLQKMIMPEKKENWGWHHKKAFELLKEDLKKFNNYFFDEALYYAVKDRSKFDPKVIEQPIKYLGNRLKFTPKEIPDPICSILKYSETVVSNHRELLIKCGIKKNNNPQQKLTFAQLFFDSGQGFSEQNSIKIQDIKIGLNNLSFNLPKNNNIKRLRFDPYNARTKIILRSITIKYTDGSEEKCNKFKYNTKEFNKNVLIFNHRDPQIHFKPGKNQKIIIINIDLDYLEPKNISISNEVTP